MSRTKGQKHVASFGQDNTAAVTHGGYSLIRKLKDGEPFKGLALDLQELARADLEVHGALEVMKETQSRHAAVALFFFGLLCGTDDIDKCLRFSKEFRLYNAKAFDQARVIAELESVQKSGTLDYEAIRAEMKGADDA